MGRSAGAGSPVWFRCYMDRSTVRGSYGEHTVKLTGRQKPYRRKKGSAAGSRSTYITREYECSCGYVGWSNHVDLARLAGDDRNKTLD